MSLYEYECGKRLELHCIKGEIHFYSVIQCAMRMADSDNVEKLRAAFPETWRELDLRYNAPGGILPEEKNAKLFEGLDS